MNIDNIKEDAEIASIDYSDRYKVITTLERKVNWMIYDRAQKQTVIRQSKYININRPFEESSVVSLLPVAARKYCIDISVRIEIRLDDNETYTYEYFNEIYLTIIEKLKLLNEYPFLIKPRGEKYIHRDNTIVITYSLYSGEILSVPKRTK